MVTTAETPWHESRREIEGLEKRNGRWWKRCPSCNEEQSYARRTYARASLEQGKDCKSCANRKTDNSHRGLYNEIRVSWFERFKLSAELRGLEWSLTIEDVYSLWVRQSRACAMTGLPIGWADVGANHTASIDRINNEKGYMPDNIQLVHKDVNMMRGAFSKEHFVEVCKLVSEQANKVKWW